MNRVWGIALLVIGLAGLDGCGGHDSPTAPNNSNNGGSNDTLEVVTFSGGVSGTFSASSAASGSYDEGQDESIVITGVIADIQLSFTAQFPGPVHTGEFIMGQSSVEGIVGVIEPGDEDNKTWAAIYNGSDPGSRKGSFTLHINDLGPERDTNGLKGWPHLHGTIEASCEPQSPPDGEAVQVHATF